MKTKVMTQNVDRTGTYYSKECLEALAGIEVPVTLNFQHTIGKTKLDWDDGVISTIWNEAQFKGMYLVPSLVVLERDEDVIKRIKLLEVSVVASPVNTTLNKLGS